MNIEDRLKLLFENSAKRQTAMVAGTREGKVLILRRSHRERWMPGRWNLPGGGIDHPAETPRAAARRECQEEAGITPDNLRLLARVDKQHVVLWVYRATMPDDQILLDPRESSDYAWVGRETVDNYEYVPDCKDWVKKVLGADE